MRYDFQFTGGKCLKQSSLPLLGLPQCDLTMLGCHLSSARLGEHFGVAAVCQRHYGTASVGQES